MVLHATGAAILAVSTAVIGPAAVASAAGSVASASSVTVFGTVQSGVEGGCLILATTYGVQYTLLGGDRTVLRPGVTALVTGDLLTGTATACMQGYPLQVKSATPF